jgi:hypothetical protein
MEGLEQMANDDEMTAEQPTTEPTPRSPAAERMRAHRERRRLGLRCFSVQLFDSEIGALIGKGLLKADARNDPQAVREALHAFFDSTLGAKP